MDRTDAHNAPELDRECETWDWTRAAGVSAEELRAALRATNRRVLPDRRRAARGSASTRRAPL
jgi:hypothetical protein